MSIEIKPKMRCVGKVGQAGLEAGMGAHYLIESNNRKIDIFVFKNRSTVYVDMEEII